MSPDPDVEVHDLNKSGSRFIILASDGVTNMIRSHDAVNMVSEFEERKRRGEVAGTSAHELVRNALRRWSERNMRADNSSAIVVYIEKKKMEPKNCHQSYTESWESTNKNRHVKTPVSEKIVKKMAQLRAPLTEVPQQKTTRKRVTSENNNLVSPPLKKSKSTPSRASSGSSAKSSSARRRSTRLAVKDCDRGLTRSAARKRASL